MQYPATRESALARLEQFSSQVRQYAQRRNFVAPGHQAVSRLSPAIRCRLITEYEVAHYILKAHRLPATEKFIQEVYWRTYWKGWLEQRPQIWDLYRSELATLRADVHALRACEKIESGKSGVEPIDAFARELIETGYLHNHARMWFASYWIHVARLPWQLGADFFYRHLLDADPASNTLSWRWVAGLQTPGKPYMISRTNLERFCAKDIPLQNLDSIDQASPLDPDAEDPTLRQPVDLPAIPSSVHEEFAGKTGIWLHGDDLSPETSPLASLRPVSICAVCSLKLFSEYQLSEVRENYMQRVMCDAIRRSGEHFQLQPECRAGEHLPQSICEWATDHDLKHVAAMRPTAGPLASCLPDIEAKLKEAGIRFHLFRRPEDQKFWPRARKGFFPFWESVRRDLE